MLASPQPWELLQVSGMSPQLSCLFLLYRSDCSGLQPEFLFLAAL